jgi:hypothetical protein
MMATHMGFNPKKKLFWDYIEQKGQNNCCCTLKAAVHLFMTRQEKNETKLGSQTYKRT